MRNLMPVLGFIACFCFGMFLFWWSGVDIFIRGSDGIQLALIESFLFGLVGVPLSYLVTD